MNRKRIDLWPPLSVILLFVWTTAGGNGFSQTVGPNPAFQSHEAGVCGLVFGNDGKTLISQGMLGEIKTWEVSTGRLLQSRPLNGQPGVRLPADTWLGFNPARNRLISAAGQVWRWPSLEQAVSFESSIHPLPPKEKGISWGMGSDTPYILPRDRSLRSTTGRSEPLIMLPAIEEMRHIAFSRDGRWLVALSSGDNGVIDGVTSTTLLPGGDTFTSTTLTIRVDEKGKKLALPSSFEIWDLLENKSVKRGEALFGHAACLAISPDLTHFSCATDELSGIQAFSLPSGDRMKTLRPDAKIGKVACLAYAADGRRLIAGTQEGEVIRCELPDGTVAEPHRVSAAPVTRVALSPDGTLLAIAEGGLGNVSVWRFPEMQRLVGMVDEFGKK